jgi:hypothetical protein
VDNVKQLIQVDRLTGEVQEGCMMWLPKRPPKIGREFIMAFQDALPALAKDRSITCEQYRVLIYLIAKLDFDNYIQVPQTEIAKELDMKPSNVSRALGALLKRGTVLRGPTVAKRATLRLSPNLGWKGNAQNYTEARNKLRLVKGGPDAQVRAQLEKHGQRRIDE